MAQLFQQAVSTVFALPDAQRDEFVRMLPQRGGWEQPPYQRSPEEEADLEASLAEAERGDFAADKEVAAVWARFQRLSFVTRARQMATPRNNSASVHIIIASEAKQSNAIRDAAI